MSTKPSWELVGTFLEVMRGGSLSAAARALGLAQPTVRRRIEALEEALGVVLFTRAPNGLVPTEAAEATRPYAEAMEASARALARVASAPAGELRGTVRVTASEIVGAEILPAAFAALRRAHPRLDIELSLTNRSEDLLRRDADVAVRMVAPRQDALVAKRVGAVAIGLFASARYLEAHGEPRCLDDLAHHALVGSDRTRGLADFLAEAGAPVRRRDFALRTDSDLAQLAAIRAGVGIGACQVPLAARDSSLRRVLPALGTALEVFVVMHEDLRHLERVRAVFTRLVDHLRRHLDEDGESS